MVERTLPLPTFPPKWRRIFPLGWSCLPIHSKISYQLPAGNTLQIWITFSFSGTAAITTFPTTQETILDPRALLFCAWQTTRRALGNPGPGSFVICCWLKQRKRVWLVNLRRGKIWTCLAKVVPPSWEFYVCFLCKSQIVNEIVKCTVFGGFKF